MDYFLPLLCWERPVCILSPYLDWWWVVGVCPPNTRQWWQIYTRFPAGHRMEKIEQSVAGQAQVMGCCSGGALGRCVQGGPLLCPDSSPVTQEYTSHQHLQFNFSHIHDSLQS